jgi:hypothetical protein
MIPFAAEQGGALVKEGHSLRPETRDPLTHAFGLHAGRLSRLGNRTPPVHCDDGLGPTPQNRRRPRDERIESTALRRQQKERRRGMG